MRREEEEGKRENEDEGEEEEGNEEEDPPCGALGVGGNNTKVKLFPFPSSAPFAG